MTNSSSSLNPTDTSQHRDPSAFVNNMQGDAAKTKSNLLRAPTISLPKGGGSIKAIDEQFSVNPARGTASFSVPLPFSPSRNGVKPSVVLSYDSGTGNSVFGIGWQLSIPSVQRKFDKKLPTYRDDHEADIFQFSGAEDLVPELIEDGTGKWVKNQFMQEGAKVTAYKPRIEGLFSRIEKIEDDGTVYWKIRSKDNEVFVFGKSGASRLCDPADEKAVFKWCLEYSYDDRGNFIYYTYKKEDQENVAPEIFNKNRLNGTSANSNIYLKSVRYGNREAWYEGAPISTEFMFEFVLDYGEHTTHPATTREDTVWPCRMDSFSDYRARFEIRTNRLCRRALMFHHFKDELGLEDYLVRSMDFAYDESPSMTYLEKIIQTGYIWKADGTPDSGASVPPLEFSYAKPGFSKEVRQVAPEDLQGAPVGLDNQIYLWTDLYSEGISGMLTEQAGAWFYKENLGNGQLGPIRQVGEKPSFSGLHEGTLVVQDLEANGKKYAVSTSGPVKGYFELDTRDKWTALYPFECFPNIDFADPNLRFIDLNGDGIPDLLISHQQEFIWYASKGKQGYDNAEVAAKALDAEKGPTIVFENPDKGMVIATADMSGDGLSDIVVVSSDSVHYYPNLGYGQFGARVTMKLEGYFDDPVNFSSSELYLADIDGSGTNDIVYTGSGRVQIWFNQSGNSLSPVFEFCNPFFQADHESRLSFVDFLGTGTICMVWSSLLPGNGLSPMKYIDMMNGKKPHILSGYKNNQGKEVSLEYRSSVQYYLDDKKNGINWISRLSFPVQCVSKVVTIDKVSRTRASTAYSYHHGFYDGIEREFRGFARVDTTDSESFEHFILNGAPGELHVLPRDLLQPPIATKTWFHTGAFLQRTDMLHLLSQEYYPASLGSVSDAAYTFPLDSLPEGLSTIEYYEACRALKGLKLHEEIFSDAGEEAVRPHPYFATHYNYEIKNLQPRASQPHAVFLVSEKESIGFRYERNPEDPRIEHNLNIETDAWGNITESARIVYGRKTADMSLPTAEDRKKQTDQKIIYSLNRYTERVKSISAYRTPVLCESRSYELSIPKPTVAFFDKDFLKQSFASATERLYEQQVNENEKRKIAHSVTLYLKDDLSGALPQGQMDSRGVIFENYLLAFTPTLVQNIYGGKFDENAWRDKGGYIGFESDNNFWIRSGRTYFHPDTSLDTFATNVAPPTPADLDFARSNFFQPVVFQDNFGRLTRIVYDKHRLFIQRAIDPLNNEVSIAGFNFRVLAPYLVKDANDNRGGVRYDALGRVNQLFVLGKEEEFRGDAMATDSMEASIEDHPSVRIESEFSYYSSGGLKPDNVKTTSYEKNYYKEPVPTGGLLSWLANLFGSVSRAPEVEMERNPQTSYVYWDGSGREVLRKLQAEPGMAPKRNAAGALMHDGSGYLLYEHTQNRWTGSGRKIYNNKGNPVKEYEPFFDSGSLYNDEKELVELGKTPLLYYDALGRLIKKEKPDGSFSKVEFTAWLEKSFDENDTVMDSRWYRERIGGVKGEPEQQASQKASVFYNTPLVRHLDQLGRTFLTVSHNRLQRSDESLLEEFYYQRTLFDVEGKARSITDARGNRVMSWKYDMLGNPCFQQSMDSGDRWMFSDVTGRPARFWDNRGNQFSYEYDALNRPLNLYVNTGAGEFLCKKYEYGEMLTDAKMKNLRGKIYRHFDAAGRVTNEGFDFRGNLLASSRQLLKDYKSQVNWNSNPLLEDEAFTSEFYYDALNRPVKTITADGSVFIPKYNEANLLNAVDVGIRGTNTMTGFVTDINYNALGQREEIFYGNGTKTSYSYDEESYRLSKLLTTSGDGSRVLQDLSFTYDASGNITWLQDNAQKTFFYGGQKVDAQNNYIYDAIYRLIEASGREHTGQSLPAAGDNYSDDWCRLSLQPNSPVEMRNYSQKYFYDSVGNIVRHQHIAGTGSWTRNYTYQPSNNQLVRTTFGGQTYAYAYNEHGSMVSFPHLGSVDWDYAEQMRHVNLGGGGEAWYVYDSTGRRVRKIVERPGGKIEERIYVGAVEVYREYNGSSITLQRETLHVADNTSRIAMVDTRTKGNDGTEKQLMRYQYSNHLGSSCLELDQDARVISYEEYHPFGTTAYQATDASRQVARKRYRYTGMERDEESGFNYHHARYYVPWLGRWLSCDPTGISDGANIFAYAGNRPSVATDTNGMWILIVAIIVGIAAGVLTSSPANAPTSADTPTEPRVSELRVAANVTMGVTMVYSAPAILAHPARAAITMAVTTPILQEGHNIANQVDPSGNASAALDIAVTVGGGYLATRRPTLASEPEPNFTPARRPPAPPPVEEGPPPPPPEVTRCSQCSVPEGTPANDNAYSPGPANDNAYSPGPANDNAYTPATPNSSQMPVEQPLQATGTDGPTSGGNNNSSRPVSMASRRRSGGGDDEPGPTHRNRRPPDRRVRTPDEREEGTGSGNAVNLRDFFMQQIAGVLRRAGKEVPQNLEGLWDRYTLEARVHENGHFHMGRNEALRSIEAFVASL